MNTRTLRQVAAVVVTLFFLTSSTAQAGFIEFIDSRTIGAITLSIEGKALRLTDNSGGTGLLRIIDNPGGGGTPATQLGFAGIWDTSTILSISLQDSPLLPSTRLDSLFGGVGLSTGGNVLRELLIVDRSGIIHSFDLDGIETIGGTVPEPASVVLCGLLVPALLQRRFSNRHIGISIRSASGSRRYSSPLRNERRSGGS